MKTKRKMFISVLILLPILLYTQNTYEFYGKFGISNLNEINYENNTIIGNKFDYTFSYEIGGLFVKSFSEDLFLLKTGIALSTIATKVSVKEEYNELDFTPYTDKYLLGIIPVQFSYAFEKWMLINVGLDNKLVLKKQNKNDTNEYILGFNGGIDFKIFDNYLLGISYSRDITPIWKLQNIDISYYSDQISIKIGYVFD